MGRIRVEITNKALVTATNKGQERMRKKKVSYQERERIEVNARRENITNPCYFTALICIR